MNTAFLLLDYRTAHTPSMCSITCSVAALHLRRCNQITASLYAPFTPFTHTNVHGLKQRGIWLGRARRFLHSMQASTTRLMPQLLSNGIMTACYSDWHMNSIRQSDFRSQGL